MKLGDNVIGQGLPSIVELQSTLEFKVVGDRGCRNLTFVDLKTGQVEKGIIGIEDPVKSRISDWFGD